MHHSHNLRDMKMSLAFLSGVAVMLPFNGLHGANPSHHVYELRMYRVKEGKTAALQTRFRDHTAAISQAPEIFLHSCFPEI